MDGQTPNPPSPPGSLEPVFRLDCAGVDWQAVAALLQRAGMAFHAPELHQQAFGNSHTTVFVFLGGHLIGCGRALSDGAYQAAIYDVAVAPEHQGQGLGRTILHTILARLAHCNVILYAAPGKEDFYRKLGFRKMQTGMALFVQAERMRERGFTE
ncbi:MAG: GNAT family N-acetyltransferase [Desulfobulbaceae bacterium A2]|nr:MAG: GNAT family N-acetyltransferase [Desulfobulbaceae bacterium A2]